MAEKIAGDFFSTHKEFDRDYKVCSKELIGNVNYAMIEIKTILVDDFLYEYTVSREIPFIRDEISGNVYLVGCPSLTLIDKLRIEMVKYMTLHVKEPYIFPGKVRLQGGALNKYLGKDENDKYYFFYTNFNNHYLTYIEEGPPTEPIVLFRNKKFEEKLFNSLINTIPR